ncbi:hypothetical protein [Hyalangium versicolor]|uniref:hypothetical protein n=1 Tax=Hyalangium versicolor TaxID=2861190 RepID=UPI001CCBB32F|nr:hypothetical protein [Hyalangium versicolor]
MSVPASQPQRLPRGIRIAAVLSLILAGLTGMSSVTEASSLSQFSEYKEAVLANAGRFGDREANEHVLHAQFSALEPMREPRIFLLGTLAVVCAFVFVAGARMLRPGGLPREGMRRLLGGAAIVAAILRTIEGAQWMVVVNQMSAALVKGPFPSWQDPASIELIQRFAPAMLAAGYIGMTALVAGGFVLLGQYFRSERVRQVVTAQDGPTE